jgi:HK97 family phage portal protein
MPVTVQSMGTLVTTSELMLDVMYSSIRMYDQYNYDYATLFRLQPNVRTCVEFLARNVAQLGLHVFERVGETDRRRLRAADNGLAAIIEKPNPWTTRYRLINDMMSDLGIYFRAYWLKMRGEIASGAGTRPRNDRMRLLRIPPTLVTTKGGLAPTSYEVNFGTEVRTFQPEEVVHFRGYNPESVLDGLSPLETLRRVLAEEFAAGEYREGFWQNAARMSGFVERPADAPAWSDAARNRFKVEFEQLYTGADNSGKTAVLEEGMTWKPGTFNAQESEYLGGRKLTREECARAYHIPLPMVGILDNATFSNIREQHKNLYQDALGPWLKMIEEDIELQLLPEFDDSGDVYCEFNIAEKLAGSFEEQTAAMQAAVGRPWMTPDEARARMNLPSMGGAAEELGVPLNILVSGEASAQDGEDDEDVNPKSQSPKAKGERKAAGEVDPTLPEMRAEHRRKWELQVARTFRRQEQAILGKVPKSENPKAQTPKPKEAKQNLDDLWDEVRWNRELQADLMRLGIFTAKAFGEWIAEQVGTELNDEVMLAWITEHARIMAEEINKTTVDGVAGAMSEDDPRGALRTLFELALSVRAGQIAMTGVTALASFGTQEAAKQGGLKWKVWQVNSSNPRDAHAAMNGERAEVRAKFSNGMMWPGDPAGGADNNANCMCSVRFGR